MKKTLIIGFALCAVLFFLAAYARTLPRFTPSASRRTPWNAHAVESSLIGVRVLEMDPSRASVDFLFDLDNRMNSDFHLTPGPTVVIMKRLKPDGSLAADTAAHLDAPAIIPGHNRTRISIEITDPFDWPARQNAAADQAIRNLVASAVSGMEGFVIFDTASRYQIELPIHLAALPASLQVPDGKAD